jgi:hypothetical protein
MSTAHLARLQHSHLRKELQNPRDKLRLIRKLSLSLKAKILPVTRFIGLHLTLAQGQPQNSGSPAPGQLPQQQLPRKPWEYVEEILRTLRTAYPLLVVSMEGIVDSINTRFKCPWDEDSYRLIVALLNDGISVRSPLLSC